MFQFLIPMLVTLSLFFYAGYCYFRLTNKTRELVKQLEAKEKELQASQQLIEDAALETHKLENKLAQTFEDPVTGLLGWQVFEDRLNQNIKESARYNLTLGVLYVDIDNFKVINDALSYEIGDALLKSIGERLQTCIRQVDSVSRFTKDTFVLLLAQLAKPETAAIVAQRILQAFKTPFQVGDNELFITIEIGIAVFPTDGQNSATLLRSADQALHLAKSKGKHGYQFYQEKMHEQSQRELLLHTSLNREDVSKLFQLYYQPIYNIETGGVFCLDVLLHMQHPQLGLIFPDEIFSAAEKQRKLNMLSEWLLQNACKQFIEWRALGLPQDCYLAIPISIKQFENIHFIYRISHILQELDFNPNWVILQIKETEPYLPFDLLEKAFNMLKYLGVKILIDNFGKDAFPLSYLKNKNINFLRIDDSVIHDIEENAVTTTLVNAILNLTQELQMDVIVKGIKNEAQVNQVKRIHAKYLQGPFLSPPIAASEVLVRIKRTQLLPS